MKAYSITTRLHLTAYRGTPETLRRQAVVFSGALRKGRDGEHVRLLSDPASTQAFLYEFLLDDVLYAEDAPNLYLPDGTLVPMMRLWVRKGATALKIVPFHVEDTVMGLDNAG